MGYDYEGLIGRLKDLKADRETFAKDDPEEDGIFVQDAKALDEAMDIISDYEKATAENAWMRMKYETASPAVEDGMDWICPCCGRWVRKVDSHCHWCGKKLRKEDMRHGRGRRGVQVQGQAGELLRLQGGEVHDTERHGFRQKEVPLFQGKGAVSERDGREMDVRSKRRYT